MRNSYLLILFFIGFIPFFGQELLVNVKVDYSQIQTSNTNRFQELEKSLKTFINTTRWTSLKLKSHEKIQANFIFVIQEELQNNNYRANLLVQSRRPVYHSEYFSPIINLNDTDFTFKYVNYQPLIFNENKFSGDNLTDVVAYYIYYLIGQDADTFKLNGGDEYYQKAEKIVTNAQNQNFSGWSRKDGNRNRYTLIHETISTQNKPIRKLLYSYHRNGLDNMYADPTSSKTKIGEALLELEKLVSNNNYTQNFFLDNLMQAKKEEIISVFSGGPSSTFSIGKLKTLLNKISPTNTDEWQKLNN